MALHYIVTGTAVYRDASLNLPTVEEDVRAMTAALEALGYKRADANPPLNPSREELYRLESWLQTCDPADDVVVYYVGHGTSDDQHYLILHDEQQFASVDLVRMMVRKPRARRVLLVLDTCESGSASLDLMKVWQAFEDRSRRAQADLTIVTSSRNNQEAQSGAFTPKLAAALRNGDGGRRFGGFNQEHLFLEDLLHDIGRELPAWQKTQADSFPPTNDGRLNWDFPNLRFKPEMPTGLDLESQRRYVERAAHWDDRNRYFTGRAQALEEVGTFLAGARGGALVVTGDPGSGKSSVLAHFVLTPGCIELPIHAKGRDLKQLLETVSSFTGIPLMHPAAGVDEARARALAKAIMDSGRRISIAIDALDEAVKPAEITRSLLTGLAVVPGVRLLIGTRPDSTKPGEPRFQGLGSAAQEIDLDRSPYFKADDLETYATTRLLEDGPYRQDQDLARRAAQAVAGKAGHTFLVAKLECDGLVKSPRALAPDEIWQSRLPIDIKTAFREYLRRFPSDQAGRVEDALRPLAFAFGQGLPLALWERLADPGDIRTTLVDAGAYVTEALEDKRSVYRLFHEKFAEFFQEGNPDEHSRITDALMPPDWLTAPAYTRRYLALHAAKASRLDSLLESTAFLVAGEPDVLRRVVAQGRSDRAIRNGGVYSTSAHVLGDDLGDRAAHLALAALKFGEKALAAEFQALLPSPWLARATQWRALAPHFVIRTEHGAVRKLALGLRRGVPVIASTGDDLRIRLWNLETLEPLGSPLDIEWDSIRVQAISIQGSTLFAATEQTLQAWDIETWTTLDDSWAGRPVSALSSVDGQSLAISAGASSRSSWIEVRHVAGGRLVREPFQLDGARNIPLCAVGKRSKGLFMVRGADVIDLDSLSAVGRLQEPHLNALGTGTHDNHQVIVTGNSDADVRIWSSETLELLAGPLGGHETYVDAVAVGERASGSVVVSGSRDGTIRVWNAQHDRGLNEPRKGKTAQVDSLAVATSVIVSGGWDQFIRGWNQDTLEPEGRPIRQQSRAVAVGMVRERETIIAAGESGLSRWDLETSSAVGEPFGEPASAVVLVTRGGRPVIIAGGDDGTIRLWDAETSELIDALYPATRVSSMGVQSLAIYGRPGAQRIIAAGSAAELQLWDLETLQPAGAVKGHTSVIYSIAVGSLDGQPVAASGSFDGTVRVWDLELLQPIGDPIRGHDAAVYAVTIGQWNGESVIVSGGRDGSVRIWSLAAHAPLLVIRLDSWIYSLQMRGHQIYAGCANGLAAIELR